jgi:hypothetical protein
VTILKTDEPTAERIDQLKEIAMYYYGMVETFKKQKKKYSKESP